VFVKVVVELMDALPPTRYVPGCRVVEVTMVVAPLPTDTLVTLVKTTGGANPSIPVGATIYDGDVEVI
jgi:hypothetical protein